MKITLSIDSKEYLEIADSDLANYALCLDDENRNASFFAKLALHPASEVRSSVADKYCLPIEAIKLLARDASINVVKCVANNQRALEMLNVSLIQEMINRDVSVAVEIADNLSMVRHDMHDELIEILLKHADPQVVQSTERFERKLDGDLQLQE